MSSTVSKTGRCISGIGIKQFLTRLMICRLRSSRRPNRGTSPLDAPIRLPRNPVPTPDISEGARQDVFIEGGDMGQLDSASLKGRDTSVSELFLLGKMWAINGIAGFRTVMPPLFTVARRFDMHHFKLIGMA